MHGVIRLVVKCEKLGFSLMENGAASGIELLRIPVLAHERDDEMDEVVDFMAECQHPLVAILMIERKSSVRKQASE